MATRNKMAIHPGVFLSEILDEIGVSQAEFARRIGISRMRISHIINGQRPITAEMAHLIGKAFGQTPQYWMNLQVSYALKIAAFDLRNKLQHVQRFEAIAA
ncbi:MAG: HigA family addiction module antidote protein [Burkholderiaceae bacterium]|jgi:addiction module HigA family antidote|nr:HigA family addiction module antidote protein [Burkholderiaceae bacterium]